MRSYIVIGGGLAGLTAANALADGVNKVTLLEQSKHLGGRAQTHHQDGYSLNLGPHALYCGGIATQTLRAWNIPFTGNFPPQGAHSYFVRENCLYPSVRDVSSLMTTRLFSLREKLEAGRLFKLFTDGQADEGETMRQWIDQRVQSQRVREFAATIVRVATYTTDLDNLSAKAALKQISIAIKHNVLYLDGGWQTLIDGLRQRAISLRVEIRCEQHIDNLHSLDADGIVLAVGPASVEKLTGISLPKRLPLYMATLDLAMRTIPDDGARVALGIDRPLYFSMHSASARLAPDGGALVHVAKYLGESGADPVSVREELEEYATLIMPQWRQYTQFTRFLPNLVVSPMMASAAGRPDVDSLGLENVAIAGDWVGSDGMLADAAVGSALKAARVIQLREALVA